jgi:hypothetical protein
VGDFHATGIFADLFLGDVHDATTDIVIESAT